MRNQTIPSFTATNQIMIAAKAAIKRKSRFWYGVLLTKNIVEKEAIDTMATDGKTVWYAPSFVDKIGYEKTAGVLIHELSHCVNLHVYRMKARDHETWNIAADYAINLDIRADGWDLPDDMLFEPKYRNWTAERIYNHLMAQKPPEPHKTPQPTDPGNEPNKNNQNDPPQNQSQDPQAQQKPDSTPNRNDSTQGSDKPQSPTTENDPAKSGTKGSLDESGKTKEDKDSKPAQRWGEMREPTSETGEPATGEKIDELAKDEQRTTIRNDSIAESCGEKPGHMRENLRAVYFPINWEAELATNLSGKIKRITTWRKPNRRHIQRGHYLPATIKTGIGPVVFVMDTSGSMTKQLLMKLMGTVNAIVHDCKPERMVVIQCDTTVKHVQELEAGEELETIELHGGGGTKAQPAFDWIMQNEDPAFIIYATDLALFDRPKDPGIETIWLTDDPRKKPPFGTKLLMQMSGLT